MSEHVVEPSEILTDKDGTVKEKALPLNPWLRLLARAFDYSLFWWALALLRLALGKSIPFIHHSEWAPLELFAWIPIESLLLATWGTTPGKRLLKIRLSQGRRIIFDLKTAFQRSFLVWFRGLGMGIVFFNILCMLFAYHRLRVLRVTSWDFEAHIRVIQEPVPQWRIVLATLISLGGFFFYYA